MPLRVTPDTTVFASAIGRQGPRASMLIDLWQQDMIQLVVSEDQMAEIQGTLAGLEVPTAVIDHWLSRLRERAQVVNPVVRIDICRKAGDNRVLEAAVEGNADIVVSNDKHLWSLRSFEGIAILKVDKFLKRLGL